MLMFGVRSRAHAVRCLGVKDGEDGPFHCASRRCPCGSYLEPRLNSTLVCTIGSVRGGSAAVESLAANLLAPLSADLGVLTNYLTRSDHPLLRLATHVWRVPEYSDWEQLVNETVTPFDPTWRRRVRFTPNLWGPLHDVPGSGAIIFSLRLVLLRFLDALPGAVYHTLVLTRTDHIYACAHPRLSPARGEVFVQSGQGAEVHGAGAVSDRHIVSAFDERQRVLAVLPWLVHMHPDSLDAPEIVLGHFFAAGGLAVRRFPRVAFTVRQMNLGGGGADASRWNSGAGDSLPCRRGLLVKYVDEYEQAVQTCHSEPCECRPKEDAYEACATINQSACRARHWARYYCAGHCAVGCFARG